MIITHQTAIASTYTGPPPIPHFAQRPAVAASDPVVTENSDRAENAEVPSIGEILVVSR